MFLTASGTGVNLQSNSTFHFDLGGTTPGNGTNFYDQINISNNATVSGNISGEYNATTGALINANFASVNPGPAQLVADGNHLYVAITGQNNVGSRIAEYDSNGNLINSDLVSGMTSAYGLAIVQVPEPSAWALTMSGLALLIAFPRKRARS